MKKFILAITINLLCFLNYGNAKVKSENITFPKHFYTEQIEKEMKVLNLAIQKVKFKA